MLRMLILCLLTAGWLVTPGYSQSVEEILGTAKAPKIGAVSPAVNIADATGEIMSYAEAYKLAKKHDKPLILVICTDNCLPCEKLLSLLKTIKKGAVSLVGVPIAKMNISENPEYKDVFPADSFPTTYVFVKGKFARKIVGYLPQDRLLEALKSVGVK